MHKHVLSFFLVLFTGVSLFSQTETSKGTDSLYVITKNDGTEYIGTILSDDGREVLIETKTLGKIYIPKSDIKSMVIIKDEGSIVNGEYQATGPFTTRYAFTTNALPVKKGENYAMINLFGPEVHFAVTNNFSLGIMATWIASPLALALKYSFKSSDSNVNYSLGTLMGTSGYVNTFRGFFGLHWANITFGDRKNNLTFSAGYCYIQTGEKKPFAEDGDYVYFPFYESTKLAPLTKGPIVSLAGITKVGAKASFVFDSMLGIFTKERSVITDEPYYDGTGYVGSYTVKNETYKETSLFLMPGMRFQSTDKKAFQFSLAGVLVTSELNGPSSFPLPMCSWFYRF